MNEINDLDTLKSLELLGDLISSKQKQLEQLLKEIQQQKDALNQKMPLIEVKQAELDRQLQSVEQQKEYLKQNLDQAVTINQQFSDNLALLAGLGKVEDINQLVEELARYNHRIAELVEQEALVSDKLQFHQTKVEEIEARIDQVSSEVQEIRAIKLEIAALREDVTQKSNRLTSSLAENQRVYAQMQTMAGSISYQLETARSDWQQLFQQMRVGIEDAKLEIEKLNGEIKVLKEVIKSVPQPPRGSESGAITWSSIEYYHPQVIIIRRAIEHRNIKRAESPNLGQTNYTISPGFYFVSVFKQGNDVTVHLLEGSHELEIITKEQGQWLARQIERSQISPWIS